MAVLLAQSPASTDRSWAADGKPAKRLATSWYPCRSRGNRSSVRTAKVVGTVTNHDGVLVARRGASPFLALALVRGGIRPQAANVLPLVVDYYPFDWVRVPPRGYQPGLGAGPGADALDRRTTLCLNGMRRRLRCLVAMGAQSHDGHLGTWVR